MQDATDFRYRPQAGFTLLEAAVTFGILAVILAGVTSILFQPFEADRENETLDQLLSLKQAIVGDPRIITKESRTDFGYIGAMGSLPSSLEDLWILGSQPVFTLDTTLKMAIGWAGPYLPIPPLELFADLALDAWGNPIQYLVETGTSTATGQLYRARFSSYGPDGDLGGGDDLTVEIYETEMLSTVTGYVRDAGGNALPGVTVKMNYPVNGVSTSATDQTSATGAFTFTDVPFGNRSLALEPQLVYVDDTAITTGGSSNDLEFVVQNFSSSQVSFTSLEAEYDVTAFYERIVVGNTTVFNNSSDRAGNGETITFASQSVLGTGEISGQTAPVRVQSPFTLTPNQDVGTAASKGGSVRIKLQNFVDVETGAGTNVDMTGVSIQATFSDGSVAIFTPDRK